MKGRIIALCGAALLSACAHKPAVETSAFAPGLPTPSATYRLVDPTDPATMAARAVVEGQLARFGFNPAAAPDIIVTIASSQRTRTIGAYSADCAGNPAWSARPAKKRWVGGSEIVELTVTMSDARTGKLLYRSTASTRGKAGSAAASASALAREALANDPRFAPLESMPSCPAP